MNYRWWVVCIADCKIEHIFYPKGRVGHSCFTKTEANYVLKRYLKEAPGCWAIKRNGEY